MLRNVNRYQSSSRPTIPSQLSLLEIVDPYNKTAGGEPFILYDSGIEDENRIVILATEGNIQKLCSSRSVWCDATFKCSPRLFNQLYTMHGLVFGHVFPLLFALTVRKTESTYRIILQAIKRRAE